MNSIERLLLTYVCAVFLSACTSTYDENVWNTGWNWPPSATPVVMPLDD